jgi:hypothetical protein
MDCSMLSASFWLQFQVLLTLSQTTPNSTGVATTAGGLQVCVWKAAHADSSNLAFSQSDACVSFAGISSTQTCIGSPTSWLSPPRTPQAAYLWLWWGCIIRTALKAIRAVSADRQKTLKPPAGHANQYLHLYAVLALLYQAAKEK